MSAAFVVKRTPTAAPFWDGLDRGELTMQRCAACGAWVFYPRRRCSTCLSDQLVWQAVEPKGTIHTVTVTHRPTAPIFAEDMPQVIAIVELLNGVRVTTTIVTDDPSALQIGQRVTAVFDRPSPGDVRLRFAPEPAAEAG